MKLDDLQDGDVLSERYPAITTAIFYRDPYVLKLGPIALRRKRPYRLEGGLGSQFGRTIYVTEEFIDAFLNAKCVGHKVHRGDKQIWPQP